MDPVPETRPCVICGERILLGELYALGRAGPEHARHHPDDAPALAAVDRYTAERPDTFPGGP